MALTPLLWPPALKTLLGEIVRHGEGGQAEDGLGVEALPLHGLCGRGIEVLWRKAPPVMPSRKGGG